MLQRYSDLLAAVRRDNDFHSIRKLVQPDDPLVKELARVLLQADGLFVQASQDFVDSFTTYKREVGDFWAKPSELLRVRAGDCDDKAILLCSILRNYIAPEEVFCAFGFQGGEGHMWVVMNPMDSGEEEDQVLEATAPSSKRLRGVYELFAIFNDIYAFSYPEGISEFNLRPAKEMEVVYG